MLKIKFAESLLTNTPPNPIHIIASNDAAESEVDMLLTEVGQERAGSVRLSTRGRRKHGEVCSGRWLERLWFTHLWSTPK